MPHWLSKRAALTPHREALVYNGQRLSFAELAEKVNVTATYLRAQGVAFGQRVGLLMASTDKFVVMVHALTRIGALIFPLNIRLTVTELAWQARHGEVSVLLADTAHAETAAILCKQVPHMRWMNAELACSAASEAASGDPDGLLSHTDLEQPCGVLYTSGTTGSPKGAIITYGNLWWSAVGSALNLGHDPCDRWLACLPLFHIGGLAILFRSLIYGISVHLHPRFSPEAVNQAIDTEGITIISVVSNMLQRMIEARQAKPYPATLRCVLLGGGPAPEPLLRICADLHLPVFQTYGLTETCSQAATLPPEDTLRKLGSAGKPLFPTELRVVIGTDDAPADEIGEIWVKGPTVSSGYLQTAALPPQPAHDAAGWLHTGDFGYFDAEGYLYVVGRRHDLIISGGENVYPAEVEAVLLAHPAVAEAGVAGWADERWGQVPIAYVVQQPGANIAEDALVAFCRTRLAAYKVPQRVLFVKALPRTASGKLQRNRLSTLHK